MGTRPRLSLIAVLLLAAPLASAAPGAGDLRISGEASLPEDSEASAAAPAAIFLNDSAEIVALSLTSPRVVVHRFELAPVVVAIPGQGQVAYSPHFTERKPTYELTNVTVSLAEGDHRGWLGIYPGAGATATLHASSGLALELRGRGRVGNSPTPEQEPDPEATYYSRAIDAPHMLVSGAGVLDFAGRGAFKFQGPAVHFESQENESTWDSHAPRSGDEPAARATQIWFFLEFEEASISIESRRAVQLAADRATLAWSGEALFSRAAGELRTSSTRYALDAAHPTTLTGDLRGRLIATGDRGGAVALLSVRGDIASTSAAAVAIPLPERIGSAPAEWWGALIVVLLVLAATLAVVVARARGGRLPGVTLWVLRRRFKSRTGEAEMRFAELLAAVADDEAGFAEAERYAVLALTKNPSLVIEYPDIETFAPLGQRTAFRAAVEAARATLPTV